jgi:hypothetical protein
MPAPYHSLASKLDRALIAYLISEEAATADNCHPGKRSLDRELPCIIVATASLDIPDGDYHSGNRNATVEIAVRSKPENHTGDADADAAAATQRAEADALFAGVVDALMNTGIHDSSLLCDAINDAAWAKAVADPTHSADLADFSCIGLLPLGESQGFDEEGHWNDIIRLRIHCCPSNVA